MCSCHVGGPDAQGLLDVREIDRKVKSGSLPTESVELPYKVRAHKNIQVYESFQDFRSATLHMQRVRHDMHATGHVKCGCISFATTSRKRELFRSAVRTLQW